MNGFGEKRKSDRKKKHQSSNLDISKNNIKNKVDEYEKEILIKALQSHSNGDIKNAITYYQYFLEKGFIHKKVFSNYGTLLHHKGDFENAMKLYERSINIYPDYPSAYSNLGVLLKDLGKLDEAEKNLKKALELDPLFPNAYSNLGVVQIKKKKFDLAEKSFKKALELDINNAECYTNLSTLMLIKMRTDEAKLYCSKAIQLNPSIIDAHIILSKILIDENRFDQAEKSIERALSINSNEPEALNTFSKILIKKGKLKEAESSIKKSITIKPDSGDAHYQLSNILFEQDKIKEAEISCKKAIKLNPNFGEAHFSLGSILLKQKKLKEADFHTQRSIEFFPNFAKGYLNLGLIQIELGDLEAAEQAFRKTIELRPKWSKGHINLGIVLLSQGILIESKEHFLKAIELQPDEIEGYCNISSALIKLGDLEEAKRNMEQVIKIDPNLSIGYQNLGMILKDIGDRKSSIKYFKLALQKDAGNSFSKTELIYILSELALWDEIEEYSHYINNLGIDNEAINPFKLLHLEDNPENLLRRSLNYYHSNLERKALDIRFIPKEKTHIGYFSTDFNNHPVMHLIAGVLEHHDKSNFNIFTYALSNKKDSYTKRIQDSKCKFRDMSQSNDIEIIKQAREDKLDIAIDLNGYTLNNRMQIFSNRVAPIQINFLGCPMTTGSSEIDYLLADKTVIPEKDQSYYSEKIIYLSNCYMCFDRKRNISKVKFSRKECGLKEESFVLAAFHRIHKITPKEIQSWSRILHKIPNSVLWIGHSEVMAKENLLKCFSKNDIDINRLIFAQKVNTSEEHLSRHSCADLFLDTFNYNAQSTAMDSLWSGLPIVTKLGNCFKSRVSASLLKTIGLENLIGENIDEYENIVIRLSKNPTELKAIKEHIKEAKIKNILFNTSKYTVELETIYTKLVSNLVS